MIDKIISGLISLVLQFVEILLYPIDTLVQNYLPSLSSALQSVSTFLSYCVSSIGWVISLVGIPTSVISLLIAYYGFALVVPALVYIVKLGIKWYRALMP